MKTGKVMVVEGVDCVGKTTLAKRLESKFGFTYLYTPQPPLNLIRKEVEQLRDFQTRFFYYLASVVAVQPAVREILKSGRNLVVDRYVYSTFVMHEVLGACVESVILDKLPIVRPDSGILLTASSDVRRLRNLRRSDNESATDRYIEQSTDLLDRAQELFKTFSELTVIDTNYLDQDSVLEAVINVVEKRSDRNDWIT